MADFDPNATQHEVKEHSVAKLSEQWAYSKQLLPALNTYQIHSATLETGVLENQAILTQLAKLKREHNLLIGLTTTGTNQVEVIRKALDVRVDGIAIFDVFQVTFNVLDQNLASVASELHQQDKRIIIKEAMANGRVFPNVAYPHYAALYKALDDMAQRYGVGVDAIALRFCVDVLHPYTCLLYTSPSPRDA